MRSETELVALLEHCQSAEPIAKRRHTVNPAFDIFIVVEEMITQGDRIAKVVFQLL